MLARTPPRRTPPVVSSAEEIFATQLVAVFDDRTGEDSKFVHSKVRRLMEPFHDRVRDYQHPPNRPNDREVVVLVPLDMVQKELKRAEGASPPEASERDLSTVPSGQSDGLTNRTREYAVFRHLEKTHGLSRR